MIWNNEIIWIEGNSLCLDVPKFLVRSGYPVTEANKDMAIKVIREVAAEIYPGMPVIEVRNK